MEIHLDATTLINLIFLFAIAIFLGVELISKVPSMLHTPLMSGSNAISGITVVGAILSTGLTPGSTFCTVLGIFAMSLATINVVGGYVVTDRMLKMFKTKSPAGQTSQKDKKSGV